MSRIANNVRALQAYTPGEQPQVPGLIKLNTNENPYAPSPRVAEALAAFPFERLRLYPDPLCRALRTRIAEMHGCAIDQVFAGNGSDEILALATRAFVEPTGSVGYFEPSYSLYPVLADIRDAARRPVDLGPDFAWQMPAGYQASLFLMTTPNAPTGVLYDPRVVAGFCAAFEGVVMIDEAYVDFAHDNCMALATAPDNRNTLVMRTLSKSYALAGLRFGYVAGPAELIAALYKIKDSYNVDGLCQALALAALNDRDHMLASVARIVRTRARLTAALRRQAWQVIDSDANFVFARPPDSDARGRFEQLRAERILVRYFPGPRTGAFLRITVGTDAEIDALLRVLGCT